MANEVNNKINSVINLNQTLVDFLRKHQIKKDDEDPKHPTNTRIGNEKSGIYGGSYHIPDDHYSQFLNIYYRDVLSKNGNEFLTEKQLDVGCITVDLDFKYGMDIKQRQHTKEHIQDLVICYLDIIKSIFQLDENTKILVFVFEKPHINVLADKKIVKDGIHMIIGIQADRTVQKMIRQLAIPKIAEMWEDLPIKNQWDEVFDEGITIGYTNWQLFGSRKPNNDAYQLTYIYDARFDPSDEEVSITPVSLKTFDIATNIHLLSVRYTKHPSFFLKNSILDEYNKLKNFNGSNTVVNNNRASVQNPDDFADFDLSDINNNVCKITNAKELEFLLNMFLDKISNHDYDLKEAYLYTMTLPEQYYGEGSYSKWIRVGWVLKHIHNKLLIVWVAFSAQSKNFNYGDIPDLCDKWKKFDGSKHQGFQKKSLMYWSKQDAYNKYIKVNKESVDHFIEHTITCNNGVNSGDKKTSGGGCGDFDIARVLHQLYKDRFVCTSVKSNIWFEFKNHRWSEVDSGTTLRRAISEELRELYNKKLYVLLNKISGVANNVPVVNSRNNEEEEKSDDEQSNYKRVRSQRILEITARLSRTNDKKNIMTEAKELFYDGNFMNKLDTNMYLLCFKNGVIDFKEKCFRAGRPEDNISICTNINYKPLDYNNDKDKEIVELCKDFLHKLFPEEELYKYMYDHLASTLIGTSTNQTFNMYIGKGKNGKSVLINLMEKVLGEYHCAVPSTMITEGRAKVGSVSPEVLQLKGKRYGVIQEPSPGEKINVGVMKQLTSGNDAILARGLYKPEATSFIPQLKLVLCSNYMMEVNSNDYGTWRRIRVVPYKSKFDENPVNDDPENPYQFKVDENIIEKFDDWKETFAAMFVERVFETNGLVKDCPIVLAASNEYRVSQDFIAEYIRDRVVKDKNGKIKKTELNNDFSIWYQSTYGRGGCPPPKDVHEYMDKEFGKQKNLSWFGVKIRYDERDDLDIPEDEEIDDGIDVNEL